MPPCRLQNRLRLGPRAVTELAVLLAGLPPEAQPRRLHALFWAAAGSETRPSPRTPQQPLWQQQWWGAPDTSSLPVPPAMQGLQGGQRGRSPLAGAGGWNASHGGGEGAVSGARNAVRSLLFRKNAVRDIMLYSGLVFTVSFRSGTSTLRLGASNPDASGSHFSRPCIPRPRVPLWLFI